MRTWRPDSRRRRFVALFRLAPPYTDHRGLRRAYTNCRGLRCRAPQAANMAAELRALAVSAHQAGAKVKDAAGRHHRGGQREAIRPPRATAKLAPPSRLSRLTPSRPTACTRPSKATRSVTELCEPVSTRCQCSPPSVLR